MHDVFVQPMALVIATYNCKNGTEANCEHFLQKIATDEDAVDNVKCGSRVWVEHPV